MKEDKEKDSVKFLLQELSEKIKTNEELAKYLNVFSSLPVEKVTKAILDQIINIFSGDLRDLIIRVIKQEIETEKVKKEIEVSPLPQISIASQPEIEPMVELKAEPREEIVEETEIPGSVMEHFSLKERFALEPLKVDLLSEDWFYIYGFCYSPTSDGKGIPSQQLSLLGIDKKNNLIILDYGDIRLFISTLNPNEYIKTKNGNLTVFSKDINQYQYEHERILNILRSQIVLVTLPFWTIIKGREHLTNLIEERYIEFLRALIDVHDCQEWDVEVLALDSNILQLSAVTGISIDRHAERDAKHRIPKRIDVRVIEKILFKEKSIAQDVHGKLQSYSKRAKINNTISLDSSIEDNWKIILSARYIVGKEKRKPFNITIANVQKEYEEYKLMIRVTSPSVNFSFQG